ncbi:uncharacterized protein LOC142985208 [Anticarsia gemmatalis]|uniref:uncharacterized protein LOC142985208 n=1 Tax=Anticarsia gemmatalis TaxID=129554 RepID=UPI003F770066
MEANDFLVKIKANGTSKDWNDLSKVYDEYKNVLAKLSTKDRGTFSLNVLCLLCRNLDKVPSWGNTIDPKDLLTLTIDCIRETRGLNKADQVKTLACVYHIHRYVVRKNAPIPPELILKLSFMAFEVDTKYLLKEYCKTYWNILADRLTYMEKLKNKAIHKLLPKLTEDVLKTIEIYDTVQFTTNILVFLFKKLHSLFSDGYSEQLNAFYGDIFKKISSKSDLNAFKKLNEKEILDLYVKFSDCLYVVAENASKVRFKQSALSTGVRTAISLLGHQSDMFHCLQTFYLNSFCDIFENNTTYMDTIFKNLTASCEITEKLGYKKTMISTYAFLNQFLRLFIEFSVTNNITDNFSVEIQENCLNFMLKILSMLKYSPQLLKCENCDVKTGLHDALRLSFLLKHFITASLQQNIDMAGLKTLYNKVILTQYNILNQLHQLKCSNHEKFYRKLQTDTHNTAISLNRHQVYEFSINLFDIYIKNELFIQDFDCKNVSRAFYNKSICELDFKLYENALKDAFLSLVFSKDLNSDKYMSLVMDIKAKYLKDDQIDQDEQDDQLQLMSVLDASRIVMEKENNENMKAFLKNVKFSGVLKHEFSMYTKLWPSIIPIAGVCRSLLHILEGKEKWITAEEKDVILHSLLQVTCTAPLSVRTIHNDHYKNIVLKLVQIVEDIPEPVPLEIRIAHTTLLFLKCEYDLADASLKYGWKSSDTSTDPDQVQITRTMEQEHNALQSALQAVELWTEIAMDIHTNMTSAHILPALQMAEIFVQQLLYYERLAHGLQLAHICCHVAQYTGHKETYIRNAGVLAYHIASPAVNNIITLASEYWADIDCVETAVIFICDVTIHYYKCGSLSIAAKLLQLAQSKVLKAYETCPDINLDLAVGRLMEAQTLLCKDHTGPSTMSAVNGLQRHYMSVINNATTWSSRRLHSVTSKSHGGSARLQAARSCRRLALYRRARAAALGAQPGPALARATHCTVNTHHTTHAQVTIDNRLKYMLGVPSDRATSLSEAKVIQFAPKQDLEIMLEYQPFESLSPTRKYVPVPGFEPAEFLKHENCDCYACDNIYCTIMCYIIGGLEASTFFRSNEFEIASNYFEGVLKTFSCFDRKLKYVLNKYKDMNFEKYVVDFVKQFYENDFTKIKLEVYMEATYFELKNANFDKADDYLVSVHEIAQDLSESDGYLSNEVMNLMIASAKVRNIVKKQHLDLEIEFENLKLSPKVEIPKTPISKPKLPTVSTKKITVKDEEIPKKRKVIKLNLDEGSSDETKVEKPKNRKHEFKIPVPVTCKPVLESITPRVVRKPEILVTDSTETPKMDNKLKESEFFTPQSTPEQFFTPMTSIKTYSKTNLRKGIVKNLEQEFSTPSKGTSVVTKSQLEVPGKSGRKDKSRTLRRAVSPGALAESTSRPRRGRHNKLDD